MSQASVRTILPLSLVTCTSMLAMDLYLPAVPALQSALGIDVKLAQATIAVFFAGLAFSQLLWGEALNRYGPRRCLQVGVLGLALSSIACALAPDVTMLLCMRLLQGLFAGAATVIAPTVVRATLPEEDAVRGIATISMIEAIIPAAGPIAGAALLQHMDWRGTFWVLAVAGFLVLPWVVRVAPKELPGMDRSIKAGYLDILSNPRFLRLALSHALCVGALLTFVASAPQLMINSLGLDTSAFAMMQVIGVAAFILTASQSGRVAKRFGNQRAVQWSSYVQVGLAAALLLAALVAPLTFAMIGVFWGLFCAALAIKGPAAFTDALALPSVQMGRASAMLILALLFVAAVGTQLVAPFMDGASAAPLVASMLAFLLLSAGLVVRYPAAPAVV